MEHIFGIDLGTTYASIAMINNQGVPEIIENFADSVPRLASVVYFPEDGYPVIGMEAKKMAGIEPDRVVQFVRREIGNPNAPIWHFDGCDYDPITISALVLKRMKEYTEEQGHDINNVVITCPAYFRVEERTAIRQAGEIAGLTVLNIVSEPSAAVLSYCCCSRAFQGHRKVLVYDLGGTTFDLSIIDFSAIEGEQPIIDILAIDGDDRLGGIDWDARLYDYICELYQDENGLSQDEMDAELIHKIRSQVEDVKRSLSNMQSRSFTINYRGDSTRVEVTREKFEELTSDLVAKTTSHIYALLKNAGLTVDDIDTVLLVGGSTRMPMIKSAVNAIFTGGKVLCEDPDLVIAKGAAIAAQISESVSGDLFTWDMTEHSRQLVTTLAFAAHQHFLAIVQLLLHELHWDVSDIGQSTEIIRLLSDQRLSKMVALATEKMKCDVRPCLYGLLTHEKVEEQIAMTLTFACRNQYHDVISLLVDYATSSGNEFNNTRTLLKSILNHFSKVLRETL